MCRRCRRFPRRRSAAAGHGSRSRHLLLRRTSVSRITARAAPPFGLERAGAACPVSGGASRSLFHAPTCSTITPPFSATARTTGRCPSARPLASMSPSNRTDYDNSSDNSTIINPTADDPHPAERVSGMSARCRRVLLEFRSRRQQRQFDEPVVQLVSVCHTYGDERLCGRVTRYSTQLVARGSGDDDHRRRRLVQGTRRQADRAIVGQRVALFVRRRTCRATSNRTHLRARRQLQSSDQRPAFGRGRPRHSPASRPKDRIPTPISADRSSCDTALGDLR